MSGRTTYIECPKVWNPRTVKANRKSLFLAGGITDCGDWQVDMVKMLSGLGLTMLNPRRADFDVTNPDMEGEQIEWEFVHLKKVRARLFWFPHATLCPITLLEFGKYMDKADPLFVGAHPDYKRRRDLVKQLSLARPFDCLIHSTLEDLAKAVKKWAVGL